MRLYNVYWDNCPRTVEVWHPDLKKILKRYADVTVSYNKCNRKLKRKLRRQALSRKLYDYRCVVDGSVWNDGSWNERGYCDFWYV